MSWKDRGMVITIKDREKEIEGLRALLEKKEAELEAAKIRKFLNEEG